MKKIIFLLLLLTSFHVFSQVEDESRILNEFIVMLKPRNTVTDLLKYFPALQTEKCLSTRMNIWLLKRSTSEDADNFLLSLKKNELVKLAQFNHKVEQRGLVPNDTYFSNQWNMLNTGQTGGKPGADIDATEAWAINHNNLTVNGDTIVIAIVDDAFDITHDDLNFYVNHHEIPNNGIDDDGNGYVDDYYGWNAYDTNGDVFNSGADPHSMHCAGIAGAIGNNALGVAGACWGAQILRVDGSSATEAIVVGAYAYVVDMRAFYDSTHGAKGAFIVSSSSSFGINANGFGYGADPSDYPIWCAMYDTMGFYGILSAAAAPDVDADINFTNDMPTGCASKWLITVTNTTSDDILNGAAAYGVTAEDLGAPGTGIYSTEISNGYGYMTGTSMSTPLVAGTVAALYAAACPKLVADYFVHPDSVALVIKQMIMSGTTRLSGLYNKTVSGGRLNLYNAIKNLDEYNCNNCNFTPSVAVTQPTCSYSCNGSAQLTLSGPGSYLYNWSTGDSGVSALNDLCPGIYSVTVTDSVSGCQRTQNFTLYKPDSILISSINIIPVSGPDSGNIIVSATAGNYNLGYSLDGVNYQPTSTLIISSNGNYTVYIANNIGCVVQRSFDISGVDEILNPAGFSIYPEPASDELNISLSLSRSANIQFTIFNVVGEKVAGQIKNIPAGISTTTNDISMLASGIYFITVSDGNSLVTRKFVVVK